jgi:GDP/UDP-N,N'-diacetylbacillosamine 2-epimerase (hydrolysing)
VNNKRTICVVTGTRAEYGLLYWILKGIQASIDLELKIIATGMHLSPEFGLTYKQIESDGFLIDRKVEMLLSSDTSTAIIKSIGLGMIGFADAYKELEPDLLLVLGDRFEIFSAVSAAMIAQIPVAHLHGGETTEGAFDEAFRHSITKMSHIHFTSTEEYRNRVVQLGEQPKHVFNVGAVGIDSIKRLKLLSKKELEEAIGFTLGKQNLLVTFHPVTLEKATAESQFKNILRALDELEETHLIFTKSNADTDGRIINRMIDDYVSMRQEKAVVHTSLGQLRYLSTIQYMDGVVGNSSSGIIEVPSFKVGTVNIGDRQLGRIKVASIIDCKPSYEGVQSALSKLFSGDFKKQIKSTVSPYGDGGVSEKIIHHIREIPLQGIVKKTFYNLIIEEP